MREFAGAAQVAVRAALRVRRSANLRYVPAIYRKVNDQIRRLQERSPLPGYTPFICECSRPDCGVGIEATLDEYSDVRADSTHFMLSHRHLDVEIERIIQSNDRFFRTSIGV
jgi:hypothetical protein